MTAAPALRVRAQVGIELRVTHAGNALRLRGELHDDLGAALPARELLVQLEPADGSGRWQKRALRSDARGHFSSQFIATTSASRVHVDFEGDSYYERASATELVTPEHDPLSLELTRPSELRVSLDAPSTEIEVRASAESGGADVPVTIQNELGRTLASGVTDAQGKLVVQLRSSALGEPGLGEIIAQSPGDATRAPARVSKSLLRTRATQLALQSSYDAPKEQLSVAVRLTTQTGPVAQRAVGVFVDEAHLVTLLTDTRGEAARVVAMGAPNLTLTPGTHRVIARFESDAPGLEPGRSQPVQLRVRAPARPTALWLLVPALASLAFALWSLRRAARPAQLAAVPSDGSPQVRLGSPIRGRAALMLSIDGMVEDIETGMPLSATIELVADSGVGQRARAANDGRFASDVLLAGTYRVAVHNDGYAPASFVLRVPHTGTGSGVRVALRSLRGMALDAYSPLSQRVFRSETVQSMATVREALTAAVSGAHAGPSLERVTLQVEQTAYGSEIPSADDLVAVQRATAVALSEMEPAAPEAPDPSLER